MFWLHSPYGGEPRQATAHHKHHYGQRRPYPLGLAKTSWPRNRSIRKACGSLHLSRAKASLDGSAGQRRTEIRGPIPCRDRQKPRLHRERPVRWHPRFAGLQFKGTYRNLIELGPLLK